jgi:hypothetical protein
MLNQHSSLAAPDLAAAACRSAALQRRRPVSERNAARARHSGKIFSVHRLIRLVSLLSLLPISAQAAPAIAWIFPAGGQRGTMVTVTVSGNDLSDVTGVFTTGAGLKAEPLPATEPLRPPLVTLKPGEKPQAPEAKNYRQFCVAIAPDAPLGRQELRVFGPSGVSNARFFQVGDQPEIVEKEPNDDSTGQLLEPPVVVNARIQQDTDVDLYTFHGKKGQRVVGEVYGERSLGMIGDSWLKGYLELRDGSGKVLAANEGYIHWDPLIDYTLPGDGDYTFAFRDLMYRGAPTAVYRLVIGTVPRATALFPFGGRRGSTVDATFVGANLGAEPTRQIPIAADAPLGMRDERLQTPSGWTNSLPFSVGDLPELREQEPNDDAEHAMRVMPPVTINGRMDRDGDVDSFRFKTRKGERLILEVLSNRAESPMDPFLRLLDSDGNVVQENDDDRDRDPRIDRTFDSADEYVVQVRDLDNRGGESFVYRLTIAPPHPDFSVTATPDRLLIGAGGTVPVDLSVSRNDGFDGDVRINLADLPPGLSATTALIRKGQEKGRLTVSAADGLPVQALALHVSGEAEIAGQRERRLAGTTETYNIQGTAFTRDLTGPIACVGAPTPVSLAVDPASLSLKAGESAEIKVRAHRRPAASGEIKLQIPDLPAGVSVESNAIPAGATEGRMRLKVDPDAGASEGNLVVNGESTVEKAAVTATSPAFALVIKEVPGFTVSIEPKELSLAQGGQAPNAFTAKATRRGGYAGPIELQWSFAGRKIPAPRIEAGQSEAKLTLKLPKEVPAGSLDLKLLASATVGTEVRVREAIVKLAVTKAAGK